MRIRSQSTTWAGIFAFASFVTLGMIGTYTYLMWRDGRMSVLVAVVVTPFFAMGSLLAFFGIRGLVRPLIVGTLEVDAPAAGSFGRPYLVVLFPRRELRPTADLRCSLKCLQVSVMRTAKTTRMNTRTLWETEWTVKCGDAIRPELGFPIDVPFPESGLSSRGNPSTDEQINWQFDVEIPLSGLSAKGVSTSRFRGAESTTSLRQTRRCAPEGVVAEVAVCTVPDEEGVVPAITENVIARRPSF